MKTKSSSNVTALAIAVLTVVVSSHSPGAPVVRSFGGDATAASVTPIRDTFRLDIGGGTTAGANGSFGGLRREINWDGVPATQSAPSNLSFNFFNTTSPRGVTFATAGTGFEVSGATTDAGAGQPAAANFGNINVSYGTTFSVFTAQRLFTALGSTVTDVNFFIPGTATAATVAGFGAIFTDVDTLGSTKIEYFNELNASLGVFNVPVGSVANGSLSFLGVSFNAGEKVGRVQITSGNTALGAGTNDNPGGGVDVVVMDDFIYSEPTPEPSSVLLCAVGLTSLLSARKRNHRAAR